MGNEQRSMGNAESGMENWKMGKRGKNVQNVVQVKKQVERLFEAFVVPESAG
eukprot:JP441802.1.p3 GENE.JP441802.1~~JP441802.1.p3  ORF type:complete len:52 (+),score=3.11 JP441802.1:83-238(+)